MGDGWVKLWRRTIDHPLFTEKPAYYTKFWVYALCRAHWSGRREGSFAESVRELATLLGSSRTRVSVMLQWFEEEEMIKRDSKRDSKRTVITIVNWKRYQHLEGQLPEMRDAERDSKRDSSGTVAGHSIEVKKVEEAAARAPARESDPGNGLGMDPAVQEILDASETVLPDWQRKQTREQWAASLRQKFPHHDVPSAMHAADEWCNQNSKPISCRRIETWLRKEEPRGRTARRPLSARERLAALDARLQDNP